MLAILFLLILLPMTLHRERGIILHISVIRPRDSFRAPIELVLGRSGGDVQGPADHVAADRPAGGAMTVRACVKV